MGNRKITVKVFELPQRLGILQYVVYEPPQHYGGWYEGWLTAEGCKRSVCIKYRVFVVSEDGRNWRVSGYRPRRREDDGGCLKQQIADALWELAERGYDVAVSSCGIVVNGVELTRPHCRTAEECAEELIRCYKLALKREPPPPDPAEELLAEWPELEIYGVEWIRKWLDFKDRLVAIASALRQHPWTRELLKDVDNPLWVEILQSKRGDICIGVYGRFWCNGKKAELVLAGWDGNKKVYRQKGLLAFVDDTEYVQI